MDSDLHAELGAHLAHLTRQYEQAGYPRDEAERRARLEFGGLDRIAAECRDARGVGLIESAAQDIRYGLRVLRKDALFSAIAAMTIAVGIGASVTIFSVVDAILLEPLPYPAPERIVLPLRLPPPAVNVGFDVFPWGRLEFLALESQ